MAENTDYVILGGLVGVIAYTIYTLKCLGEAIQKPFLKLEKKEREEKEKEK